MRSDGGMSPDPERVARYKAHTLAYGCMLNQPYWHRKCSGRTLSRDGLLMYWPCRCECHLASAPATVAEQSQTEVTTEKSVTVSGTGGTHAPEAGRAA